MTRTHLLQSRQRGLSMIGFLFVAAVLVIVAMLAIGVVGILIELSLRLIESRLQGWRRSAY